MRYVIDTIMQEDYLWRGIVEVLDDTDNIVLTGETLIACESSTEAKEYMEKVFLPDLRVNFPRLIGDLVFDWEVLPDEFDPTEEGLGG